MDTLKLLSSSIAQQALVIKIVGCCLLTLTLSTFAVPAGNCSDNQEAELRLCERAIFGDVSHAMHVENRLRSLELDTFGSNKSGSVSERICRIINHIKMHPDRYANVFDNPTRGDGLLSGGVVPPDEQIAHQHTWESMYLSEAAQAYSCGDLDRAASTYYTLLRFTPENVVVYYNLGAVNQQQGARSYQHGEYSRAAWYCRRAAECFKNGLFYSPDDPRCLEGLAAAKRTITLADQEQRLLVAEQQQKRLLQNELGKVALEAGSDYKAGRYPQAIAKLLWLEKHRASDPGVQYGLANAYRASGDIGLALPHASKAVELAPNEESYRGLLARILQEYGTQRGNRSS